jgi:hypothetical protein
MNAVEAHTVYGWEDVTYLVTLEKGSKGKRRSKR